MELVKVDEMRSLRRREQEHHISRLYSPDMESAARAILKSLGELKRPYLTALEEKLLGVLEEEYKVIK